MRNCETCKQYREAKMRDREGMEVAVGYCHATSNFAKRQPEDTCKRWAANPKRI